MTYEEAIKRLEDWYAGEDVNISPELLTCCYNALKEITQLKYKTARSIDQYAQFYVSNRGLASHYK